MKTHSKHGTVLVLCVVIALLTTVVPPAFSQVPPAARQPRAATRENALAKRVKTLRKPSDPEAAALLLNLIARYAADVPDKTDLDRKIEAALGGTPESRQSAQRMIDRFHKLPAEFRQETYGKFANVTTERFAPARYETVFSRVLQTLPRIDSGPAGPRTSRPMSMSLGTDPTYMIRYRGLACFAETDWDQSSGSDEIYEIDVVTYRENGELVSKTVKQPQNKDYYAPVDGGGFYAGPFTYLYEGPARELTFSSLFFEQDFGNATEQRDMINTGVKAGLTAACNAALSGACSTAPLSTIVGYVAKLLGDLIADILDFEDDLIDEDHFIIPRDQLVAWGAIQPPPLDDRGMQHHFEIIHQGEGAFDKTYFEVGRTENTHTDIGGSGTAPPPRGFVPAPQASPRDVEGGWGDTNSESTSKVVVVITGTPSGSGTFAVRSREHIIGGSDSTASADGLQLGQDGTWSWVGPLFDMATIARDAPGGVRGTGVFGGMSGSRAKATSSSDLRVPGGRAYTLSLPNNVRLQSFIEDRPPEEVKNYRIRYVRLDDAGRVVTDVMLLRTQMTPR